MVKDRAAALEHLIWVAALSIVFARVDGTVVASVGATAVLVLVCLAIAAHTMAWAGPRSLRARPSVVTFLLTDVEGSSRLWEARPEDMRRALVVHDEIVASCVGRNGGTILTTHGEGDSIFAVFPLATGAVAAAVEIQHELGKRLGEPPALCLRVRIALHTAEAGGDYRGPAANRCARVRAIARGGEILLTAAAAEIVRDALPAGMSVRFHGEYELRDLRRSERVFELLSS